ILCFADAGGGLVMDVVSDAYASKEIRRGTHVVSNHFLTRRGKTWASEPPGKNSARRKERMEQLLRRSSHPPSPEEVFALSRDRRSASHPLCNADTNRRSMTISAQLQVISRAAPQESVNYVCCGNTRHSVYLPVPLAFEETFLPLLDGTFYRAADRLYRKHRCSAHLRKVQRAFERSMPGRTDYADLYREALRQLRRAASDRD
ncbi:MAG: hypothetical protein KAX44_00535, partial [Candidatus Brocadiae bacterium]|nr:hypothetical protein [Candidatus Brocadiia bacterium]